MNSHFQRYVVYTEILSTFHTRAEYQNILKNAIQTNGTKNTRYLPFSLVDVDPYLIHPSLDRPHSPSQTTYRSNRPFCRSTPSGQTDRPTDRWARRQACTNTGLRSIILIESDAANNKQKKLKTKNQICSEEMVESKKSVPRERDSLWWIGFVKL